MRQWHQYKIYKALRAGMAYCVAVALTALAGASFCSAAAQQHTIKLYEGTAPGSEAWQYPEIVMDRGAAKLVLNVRVPEMRVYLPDQAEATGAAIVLLPGGALRILSMGQGTDEIIDFYNERGVAVIVLKYRTLQIDPAVAAGGMRAVMGAGGGAPMQKLEIKHANANPTPHDATLTTVLQLAVTDAQVAMRMIRAQAEAWHINPHKVGMLGISAGGGVAMGAILAGDKTAAPDFFISIYGPSLQDVEVPKDAPPLFLAVETNHGPVTEGLTALYTVWQAAKKPAELHIYDVPTFAMPVELWGPRSFDWLQEQNIVAPATQD